MQLEVRQATLSWLLVFWKLQRYRAQAQIQCIAAKTAGCILQVALDWFTLIDVDQLGVLHCIDLGCSFVHQFIL
jgi:hypothetical protein